MAKSERPAPDTKQQDWEVLPPRPQGQGCRHRPAALGVTAPDYLRDVAVAKPLCYSDNVMKRFSQFAVLVMMVSVMMVSCGTPSLFGTPYSSLKCSQLACLVAGHAPATARQLFDEGAPIIGPLQPGDIVAFGGAHVAVVFADGSLVDSTPERGVGRVSKANPHDLWYAGPLRVVKK